MALPSELVTGLIGVAVVLGSLVGILALSIVLQKRKVRRMQEDRKKLIEVYGFTERPQGGLQGMVGNSRMEIFLATMPIPAADPLHPSRRQVGRPGHMSGIDWADALQITASCAPDQQWFLCEYRTDWRYGEDKVTDHKWHDYFRMKFEIPGSWTHVPSGNEIFDSYFIVFSAGGAPPTFFGRREVYLALQHWGGQGGDLRLLFATARDGKLTTQALRRAFEKTDLGLFEDLDRRVRLAAAVADPTTAQEQLGRFFS